MDVNWSQVSKISSHDLPYHIPPAPRSLLHLPARPHLFRITYAGAWVGGACHILEDVSWSPKALKSYNIHVHISSSESQTSLKPFAQFSYTIEWKHDPDQIRGVQGGIWFDSSGAPLPHPGDYYGIIGTDSNKLLLQLSGGARYVNIRTDPFATLVPKLPKSGYIFWMSFLNEFKSI